MDCNVFHQIIYFQKVFDVCYMEYTSFILPYSVNLRVHKIAKKPGRVNHPGTFKLSAFVCKLLIFMRHTLANKNSSTKFWISKFFRLLPRCLYLYIIEFFCLRDLNLTITLIFSFDGKYVNHQEHSLLLVTMPCKCFLPKHLL